MVTQIFALTRVCCFIHSRGVNVLVNLQQLPVELEAVHVSQVWECFVCVWLDKAEREYTPVFIWDSNRQPFGHTAHFPNH